MKKHKKERQFPLCKYYLDSMVYYSIILIKWMKYIKNMECTYVISNISNIFHRRRFGNRSSQRTNATLDSEEEANRSGDMAICDENENVSGDYMFKRYSQDAIRKSNLSINSCVSIGSTMSSYGRKKRRAPQPPRRSENVETNEVSQIFYLNIFKFINFHYFIISDGS